MAIRGRLILGTVVVAALLLAAGTAPAAAATCTWTGGSADWQTSIDWDCGHVPTSSDDVVINDFESPDVATANANARSISESAGGGVNVETGRTLTVSTAGTSSFGGHINIKGTGVLTLGDPTTWSFTSSQATVDGTLKVNSTLSVTAAAIVEGAGVVKVGAHGSITADAGSMQTVTFVPLVDNDGTCTACAVTVSSGTLELQNGDAGSTTGKYKIASGATLQVDGGTFDAPSVTGAGTFAVAGGSHLTVGSTDTFAPHSLTITGGGTEDATFNRNVSVADFSEAGGGTRDGTGALTITGTASLGGALNGGTTTVADTATSSTIAVSISMSSTATLTLDAATTAPGNTSIVLGASPSALNINANLDITGSNAPINGGTGSVVNVGPTGSITADPGANHETDILIPVNNDGTITAHTGTLVLFNGSTGTNTGGYVMDADGTLMLDGSNPFDSPSITGPGILDISGPTVTVGATDTFSPTNLRIGNGGTLTLNRDASIVNLLSSGNGSRNGSGTLTITGSADFGGPGGPQFTGGTTTIASTVGPITFPNTGGFTVNGATLNLDSPATLMSNNIGLSNGSTLNVNSTLLVPQSVSMGFGADSALHISSTGFMTVDPGSGQSFSTQTQIHNDGTVDIVSGTLSSGGFTQTAGTTTVSSGADLDGSVMLSGGTLKGDGTLGGPVSNPGGTVAPGSSPGTLTIRGDYTQGAGGTLAEEIAGTTPGSQFDHLVVGGVLTLDGTLAIDSTGFTPAPTDTFKIISGATSRTGTFAAVTGAVAGSDVYTPQYDTDGVTLTLATTPPPSNNGKPSISGTPAVGQTLTCDNGSWTGNPTAFAYQWNRDGDPIPGATSQTYVVQGADQGHTLTCTVIASNNGGPGLPATSEGVAIPAAPPPAAPTNTAPPSISGTAAVSQTLTCDNGSWTGNPTAFTYQWNRDGNPIPGATGQTYVVQLADQGHTLTCSVIASNDGGPSQPATSSGLQIPAPTPPGIPTNTTPPSISGAAAVGQALTCGNGTWANGPTGFGYQWNRIGTPIQGASGSTYEVQTPDEGTTLTCTVTATNQSGSAQATSNGVQVPVPFVLGCPAATGSVSGTTVGLAKLGMTRRQARHAFTHSSNRGFKFKDFFCLTPFGERVGYASPKLLKTLPRRERRKLAGRVVWISTDNARYADNGIRAGATLSAAEKALPHGDFFRVGKNFWYLAPAGTATAVLKVRHSIVEEIGIADKRLTRSHRDNRILMTSFE